VVGLTNVSPGICSATARTVQGMAPYPGQARCLALGFWPECFRRLDVKGGRRPFPEETRSALDIEGKHVTIQGPSLDLSLARTVCAFSRMPIAPISSAWTVTSGIWTIRASTQPDLRSEVFAGDRGDLSSPGLMATNGLGCEFPRLVQGRFCRVSRRQLGGRTLGAASPWVETVVLVLVVSW
jgi:hypothetical protein